MASSNFSLSLWLFDKEAQEEFGRLDPLAIGAIALARRVQNPLSELVKVPPQSLGVGMYQHDLSPKDLEKHLDNVVSIVVSDIGVDVNNASMSLLRRVSGLNRKTACAIFEYVREQKGISCREDLLKIKGIGQKTYEQCAGFLKVYGGKNYLDETNIHPESYNLTENMCKMMNIPLVSPPNDLVGRRKKKIQYVLGSQKEIKRFQEKFGSSKETFVQILKTLEKPNFDPRENIPGQQLRKGPQTLESLKVSSVVTGTIQNVAPFGAFVDIGVGTSALLHNSKTSAADKRRLGVGQSLELEILSIDTRRRRISVGSLP